MTFASAASNESFTSLLDAESIAASRSALTSPLAAESLLAVDAPMVGTTAGRLGGTVEGVIWYIKFPARLHACGMFGRMRLHIFQITCRQDR